MKKEFLAMFIYLGLSIISVIYLVMLVVLDSVDIDVGSEFTLIFLGILGFLPLVYLIYIVFKYSKNLQYKSYVFVALLAPLTSIYSTTMILYGYTFGDITIMLYIVFVLIYLVFVLASVLQYTKVKQRESIVFFLVIVLFDIAISRGYFRNLFHGALTNGFLYDGIIVFSTLISFVIPFYVIYVSIKSSDKVLQ